MEIAGVWQDLGHPPEPHRLADQGNVARVFRRTADLIGIGDGLVRPEIIWAALDCPGYFAMNELTPGLFALLGRLAVRIDARPRVDETCIVAGWHIASEGRRHVVGTALFRASGELLAIGRGTWMALKNG